MGFLRFISVRDSLYASGNYIHAGIRWGHFRRIRYCFYLCGSEAAAVDKIIFLVSVIVGWWLGKIIYGVTQDTWSGLDTGEPSA